MKTLGIIPARYGSTRFPGKPLVVIDGKTMIRRVYEQACTCELLDRVVVATDDSAIFNHIRQFGDVVMTGTHHSSGSERCCEVGRMGEFAGEYDVIINIQGDEPFIHPEQIGQVISCFSDPQVQIATLVKRITLPDELASENVVKAVVDRQGYALFFSRAAIPFTRGTDQAGWLNATRYYKHIGIYGYLVKTLEEIVALPVSDLERAESLEQLRWLDNGYRIKTKLTDLESIAIDTPGDLLKITNTKQPFQR